MAAYDDVHAAWQRLSQDGHIGMSDAFQIVAAAGNADSGRAALAELLADDEKVAITDPDALSVLRVNRDLPLPPGVPDHRADGYFRCRFYTGTRLSRTHRVSNPKEFLYFNIRVLMLTGTLDDVAGVRRGMQGSGYEPVVARVQGRDKAIGIVMVNEFRDTTFGPYNEVIFIAVAAPRESAGDAMVVDYANPFSLQVPLDRGATTYAFKLWLDELSPIDGGNDYLGTNKELGCFSFEDRSDGTRHFRCWDRDLKTLVSGAAPRTVTVDGARRAEAAYRIAARKAGTAVPASTATTLAVASRPDQDVGKPATTWAFAVDWRKAVHR